MKPLYVCLALVALASATHAQSLKENAFFSAVSGTWNGTGEVTTAEPKTIPATNKIEAGFTEDGQMFFIKGSLHLGEEGTAEAAMALDYRWEYQRAAIEGLYAARFFDLTNNPEPSDFEVAIDEENMTAKLNQTSGSSSDPRIEMTTKFENENYIIEFTFIDPSGQDVLKGKLTFEREK